MKPAIALLSALAVIALAWNYWAMSRPPRPKPNYTGRYSSDPARSTISSRPATTLDGRVRMAGSTSHVAHVDLVRVNPDGSGRVYAADEAMSDGHFVFNRVMEGPYWIVARTEVDPDPLRPGEGVPQVFYGMSEVTSDGLHPGHVAVELLPASTMSGKVLFEPASAGLRELPRLTVSLTPVDEQAKAAIATGDASAVLSADGQFTITEIPPGQYRLDISPTSWMLDTVTVGNRDGLDRAFNVATGQKLTASIALTEHANQIAGTLRDVTGRVVPFGLVTVFPVDIEQRVSHRRVQLIRSDAKGAFRFEGLPSGNYLLASAGGFDPVTWRTPEFFERLTTTATRVTLGHGRVHTFDLRASGQ